MPLADRLPAKWVAKNWSSLWHPRLNIAWLPVESVFLRVVELPAANAEETAAMVELQLEKYAPIPVTQIVWTMHLLGTHPSPAKADGTVESLQSVIVVLAERTAVEEFLGRLERDGFLSDRLEAPMLDQLEAVAPKEDGVWLFPMTIAGQNAALAAWWYGGAWRGLNVITLPPAGDRAGELKTQLSLLAMGGEVEGWLTGPPRWHLVADPVNATEWEQLLRAGLNEPVQVIPPPVPVDLAARSAKRAAAAVIAAQLQPPEFSARYKEQFFDRLWLRGLGCAGLLYVLGLVLYFCWVGWLGYQTRGVETQMAALSNTYTNAMQMEGRLGILQSQAHLKYAALDCWQLVAENLPSAVTLQRFALAEGSKLTLSGQVNQADMKDLSDFWDNLRKTKLHGELFFDSQSDSSSQPLFHLQNNNIMSWSFSLKLLHGEITTSER